MQIDIDELIFVSQVSGESSHFINFPFLAKTKQLDTRRVDL